MCLLKLKRFHCLLLRRDLNKALTQFIQISLPFLAASAIERRNESTEACLEHESHSWSLFLLLEARSESESAR